MSVEQLETDRLVLEPIGPQHAVPLFPYVSDVRLYDFVDQNPPKSASELELRYRIWSRGVAPDGSELWLNWAARLRGAERYVGWFQATVRANRSAEIAYVTFVDHQRQGYAREGCEAVIKHLTRSFGTTTIVAMIDPRNEASIALAKSLGMSQVELAGDDLRFALEVA